MIYIGRNMHQIYEIILKRRACTAVVVSDLDQQIDFSYKIRSSQSKVTVGLSTLEGNTRVYLTTLSFSIIDRVVDEY